MRHSLSQAQYELRQALGDDSVVVSGDRLLIGEAIETDLGRFEAAIEQGHWAQALDLYGGSFLEGAQLVSTRGFEEWLDRRRAQAVRHHRRARRELVADRLQAKDLPGALAIAARWAELEPLDDEAQQRTIELLARTGRRAEALRQYEGFRELLRREELEPMPELEQLAASVAAGALQPPAGEPPEAVPPSVAVAVGPPTSGGQASTGAARELQRETPAPVAVAPAPRLPSSEAPSHGRTRRRGVRVTVAGGVLLGVLVLAAAGTLIIRALARTRGRTTPPTVAVLPFANLSGDPRVQAFVDGIHDDVLNHLYGVATLRVISRTSVMQYRNSKKTLRQIGADLGASAILEGGVQRAGDSVRINVQLADAATDNELWAEGFTRQLTADNVFELQTEIATHVAGALRAHLGRGERRRLTARRTTSLEAYDLYNDAMRRLSEGPRLKSDLLAAIELVGKAVALDSSYAAALAQSSLLHQQLFRYWYDRTPARQAAAEEAAVAALRLDPDLAAAHIAMGTHYLEGTRDLRAARVEFGRALELEPSNPEALAFLATADQRQGDLQGAHGRLLRVIELDPRNYRPEYDAGMLDLLLHRYDKAAEHFSRAIQLQPSWANSYSMLAWTYMARSGDRTRATEVLLLARRRAVGGAIISRPVTYFRFLLRTLGPGLDPVLRKLEPKTVWFDTAGYLLVKADLFGRVGPRDSARIYLERLRAAGVERVRRWPEESAIYILLSVADIGLGHPALAVQEAERATLLFPIEKDVRSSGYTTMNLAWTYAMTGDRERAVATLEKLFAAGGGVFTPFFLEADPGWDSLRGMPRFQRLLKSAPVKDL